MDAVESLTKSTCEFGFDERPRRPPLFGSKDGEHVPAPQIHSKGVVATDITAHFIKATKRLKVGQLIKDDFFTLFESVGAIEIMDPKMDTGFLSSGERMDDDYDVMRDLLPEEVLGVIDQLICFEMGWHMGHPLSQTLFTSLYIDNLLSSKSTGVESFQANKGGSITLQVLQAYCLGLIKTCNHVNNRVKSEHFYEEEDFVTHTYNRSLLDEVEDEFVYKYLEEAQEALSSSKLGSPRVRKVLCRRLSFRAAFLKTVSIADQRSSPHLKSSWNQLLALIPSFADEKLLSKPVPDSFSAKLQRKLASTVPPRPVVTVPFEMAYDHLLRLCHDGQVLTEVLQYHDSQSLLTFVMLFQSRKPQPSVYIRTLLQYYIFGDMLVLGRMSIRQLLDDDFSSIVLPEDELLDPMNDSVEVPHDPRFNMAKRMEIFRSRAAQAYLDVLRTACQNRCRIRRNLNHTIVDWDNLQLDAEELDIELRVFTKEKPIIEPSISTDPIYSFPLSSWAYFYKLRQMELIVQMGFELEVYQVDELAGMYWYLQNLTQTRLRHLERIRGFIMRRFAATGKDRKASSQKGFGRALSFINFSMLEATATQALADALSGLYVVLSRLSAVTSSSRPYSDNAIRYELRMKPFLAIGLPELLSYDQFQLAVTQPDESTSDFLQFAGEAATRAKKDFELMSRLDGQTARCRGSEERWQKNVKDCMKACISTNISISIVKKAFEAAVASNRKEKTTEKGMVKLQVEVPPVGKGYHDWWVVPKIMVE